MNFPSRPRPTGTGGEENRESAAVENTGVEPKKHVRLLFRFIIMNRHTGKINNQTQIFS